MQNKKEIKKCYKQMCKLLKKKFKCEHPSKEEMIAFVKKYHNQLDYVIVREHDDSEFEPGSPFSYMQYLLLFLNSPISSSHLAISTLPWREIVEILEIPEDAPRENWIDERFITLPPSPIEDEEEEEEEQEEEEVEEIPSS